MSPPEAALVLAGVSGRCTRAIQQRNLFPAELAPRETGTAGAANERAV